MFNKNPLAIHSLKKFIVNQVKRERNLTPSEIVEITLSAHPSYSLYEIKYLVKEMQKNNELIPDIIYGGLTTAS